MPNEKKILVGKIVGPQGLRGEVRVQTYTASPLDFKTLDIESEKLKAGAFHFVRLLNPTSSVIVAKIDGVDDRNAADDLRDIELFINRGTLPEPDAGEYYVADLIGMNVIKKSTGEKLGIVTDFKNFGGGDILELDNGEMVLFGDADVDMAGGIIKVL